MSKACGGAGRKKVSGLSGAARLSQKGSRRKRSNGAPAMAQQDLDAGDHCDCCGGAIAADDGRAMSITDEELLRTMKRRRLLVQHVRASHPEFLDTEEGRAWLWSMDTITDTQAQQQKQAREQAAMAPDQEDRDPVDRDWARRIKARMQASRRDHEAADVAAGAEKQIAEDEAAAEKGKEKVEKAAVARAWVALLLRRRWL